MSDKKCSRCKAIKSLDHFARTLDNGVKHRCILCEEDLAKKKYKGAFREFIDQKTLYDIFDGKCGLCQKPLRPTKFSFEHLIPLSQGGTHSLDNVIPAHRGCNAKKADLSLNEFWGLPPSKKRKRKSKARFYNSKYQRLSKSFNHVV